MPLPREGQEGLLGSGPGFGKSVFSRAYPWAKELLEAEVAESWVGRT